MNWMARTTMTMTTALQLSRSLRVCATVFLFTIQGDEHE